MPRLAEGYHGINVKLQKAGGIRETLRIIDVARACGLKVMIGCMVETSVGIAAAAHLGPLADWLDLDGNLLIAEDPFRGHPVVEGRIQLGDGPGLGVEPRTPHVSPALIQDPMSVLAVLLGVIGLLFLADRHPVLGRFFRVVPLLVFIYFVPTLLSNTGDHSAPVRAVPLRARVPAAGEPGAAGAVRGPAGHRPAGAQRGGASSWRERWASSWAGRWRTCCWAGWCRRSWESRPGRGWRR